MMSILAVFAAAGSFLTENLQESLLTFLVILVVYLGKKYLIPLLNALLDKNLTERLLILSDDIIDEIVLKNPDSEVAVLIQRMVDELIASAGVKREVAERVINVTIQRKMRKGELKASG